jgi:hypothetical protein|tara:strand:- start:125 stop:277 length:153 start_codon:yes stop_codon:yes gene_type:complete
LVYHHCLADEQRFARSANVDIPDAATAVITEVQCEFNGWSGERFERILGR